MPTIQSSGTLTPNGTEQTIDTITAVGTYQLVFDLGGMVDGDVVLMETYSKTLSGGTERKWENGGAVYNNVQSRPMKAGPIVQSDISYRPTIKATGTVSAIPWKIIKVS